MKGAIAILALLALTACNKDTKTDATVEGQTSSSHDARFVGYWNQRFELREDPDRDEAEMKLHERMTANRTATIRIEADGTFLYRAAGFENKGEWTSSGDKATLTVTSGPAFDMMGKYSFDLELQEDESLQGDEMGYAWHLTRIEE